MAKRRDFPGNLRLRKGSWKWTGSVDGSPVYATFDGRLTETQARDAARAEYEKRSERALREAAGVAGAMRMSELLKAFEAGPMERKAEGTRKAYRSTFKRLRTFFVTKLGDPDVSAIYPQHVDRFISWRAGQGVAARTVGKDHATLHTLFAYAVRTLRVLDRNPAAGVQPPKADPRTPVILSAVEYDRLIAKCEAGSMLRMFVVLLGEGGLRFTEGLRLRWTDIDFAEGFVHVQSRTEGRTKSGKSRYVPMTARLAAALREHALRYRGATYGAETSPWVFHHTTKRRHAKAGARITNLRRGFQNATKRAKLPADLHIHDLRHRRVTAWLAEGASITLVAEALGHSTTKVTEGYKHLAKQHLRALVDPPKQTGQSVQSAKRAKVGPRSGQG